MRGAAFTPEIVSRAQELRERGMGWHRISVRLGVGEDGLRRRLDARYRDNRNAAKQSSRGYPDGTRISDHEAKAILSSVPIDTRSLTARVLGDPLPGRSALDKRELTGNKQISEHRLDFSRVGIRADYMEDRHSSEAVE